MFQIINKIKLHKTLNADSLKGRVLRGGMWLGAGGAIQQILRLARNMILTRILVPDVFGLMAIILAINAAFESFTQVGIKEAIIQNPNAEDDIYLNGAWWLSFGRSIVLFVLGVVGSLWIVDFYHISENLRILQLSFISVVFNGAFSARAYVALKKMEYKKWIMISSGGGIIGITISIILSYLFHNVLALVIGAIFEAAARCILSFVICPFIPRFHFAKRYLKELFTYARGMFGLPILYFIYANAPIIFVGKLCARKEVGLYSLVSSIAEAPPMVISLLLSQILMPAFSSRQKDHIWLSQTILRSTRFIVFIGIPFAVFAALYARNILTLIYGAQYADAAVPFAILMSTALMATFSSPMATVYLAVGQPQLHRLFSGIRAVLIALLIFPLTQRFGLIGAATAVCFSMVVSYVFQVARMKQLIGLDTRQYSRIFVNGAGLSVIVIIIWLLTHRLFSSQPLLDLACGIIMCSLVYGIIVAINYQSVKKSIT